MVRPTGHNDEAPRTMFEVADLSSSGPIWVLTTAAAPVESEEWVVWIGGQHLVGIREAGQPPEVDILETANPPLRSPQSASTWPSSASMSKSPSLLALPPSPRTIRGDRMPSPWRRARPPTIGTQRSARMSAGRSSSAWGRRQRGSGLVEPAELLRREPQVDRRGGGSDGFRPAGSRDRDHNRRQG